MKVVLLCRVSTESQDYTRQVNELTDYCDSHKWSIEKVFANKSEFFKLLYLKVVNI